MRFFRGQAKQRGELVQQGNMRSLGKSLPRLLSYLRPHVRTLALGFLGLCFGSGINLLFPYLVRAAINDELGLSLEDNIGLLCLGLVALFALQAVFFCIRHFCFQVVGLRIVTSIREHVFAAVLRQDIAYFDRSRVGDLLSRINSDTEVLQRALTINVSVGLRYLLQVSGGILLLFWISAQLTVLMLLCVPLLVLASLFWSKRLRGLSRRMQEQLGEASVVAEEAISSIRTVRLFSAEAYELQRFTTAAHQALETGTKRTRLAAVFSSSMVFLLHSAIALILWHGGRLVLAQELSIGDFTGFMLYVVLVAVSFAFLTSTWVELLQASGAAERIFDILDEEPDIRSIAARSLTLDAQSAGEHVRFDAVGFEYPSRPGIPVLKEVSFSIAKGETVALVGPSGAGKSTIASLLLRFYDPSSGEIRFNGRPLQEMELKELRSRIAVVPQVPHVFSVSLSENIRYGKETASEEAIRQAASLARLDTFIQSLPQGYDTLVGDKGIQLSGGERQRVAIARAILQDPEFLLLDEATSGLDSENERLIQTALQELMRNRSALIIAHRLSTVQHADRVLVLRNGLIEQVGTHQELIQEPGLYKTLVQHQLLN